MIIKKKDLSYTSNKKYIQGKGFLDSLSSTLKNIGSSTFDGAKQVLSYVSQNKDLIAKPVLGAVGNLAAFGLTEVGKQQLTRLIHKPNKTNPTQLPPKNLEIIQNILPNTELRSASPLVKSLPTTNIIGSGIKKF